MTCVKDEGPWLLDWIAHHKAIGFTDFLIASHDCSDGTDRLLEALDHGGLITHIPFVFSGKKSAQWQALKLLSDHPKYQKADLALFFDVDEYVTLTPNCNLSTLLPDTADAVPLRWHLFGNSGQRVWEDAPVTERFTMCAPEDIILPLGHFFKTLHRPSAFGGLGIHRPKGKTANWISAAGNALPHGFSETQSRIQLYGIPSAAETAWLNHYSVRSIEEFILKSVRGLPNHMEKAVDVGYWVERNFNVVKDERINWMLPAAQAARETLSEYDALHADCVQHHRRALATLLTSQDILKQIWRLELAASSTPPTQAQFAAHAARLRANQESKE